MTAEQSDTIDRLKRYRFTTAPLRERATELPDGTVRIVVPMFQYRPRVIEIHPQGVITRDD